MTGRPRPEPVDGPKVLTKPSVGLVLPALLAVVTLGAVAYLIAAQPGGCAAAPCEDAVPRGVSGLCPRADQRLSVEDGAVVCRCGGEP